MMFDILKMYSKSLNAQFKITVYLPEDYDKNNHIYEAIYIVSNTNPFNDSKINLEDKIKNKIIFSIYPEKNISKNSLLYNSFDDYYGFSKLYEEFIINEIRPYLVLKYRVNKDFEGNSILGYDETAILAYNLAFHYTMKFDKMYLYNLNLAGFDKLFHTDLVSSFTPFISIFYKTDTENEKRIETTLRLLGSLEFQSVDTLDDMLKIM